MKRKILILTLMIALITMVMPSNILGASPEVKDKVPVELQPTDPDLIEKIIEAGIDPQNVEITKDYGKRDEKEGITPYSRVWGDKTTSLRFMEVSGAPMVDFEGKKLNIGWIYIDGSYYTETISGDFNNIFYGEINGTQVILTAKNDQPNGILQGQTIAYNPQLFIGGELIEASEPILFPIDPYNPNYSNNVIRWTYGEIIREIRMVEGVYQERWIFNENPNTDVRIVHNQTGDYRLKLGHYAISDDVEFIPKSAFDLAETLGDYPLAIDANMTFFPDTGLGGVDGDVYRGTGGTWTSVRDGAGTNARAGNNQSVIAQVYTFNGAPNDYIRIMRSIFTFDTSGLPDGALISAATFSVYGKLVASTGAFRVDVNVFLPHPATDTALVIGDYDSGLGKFEDTPLSDTDVLYAAWSIIAYNDFALNATGLAVISKTGYTRLGTRDPTWDGSDTPLGGAWENTKYSSIEGWNVEQGGGFRPKLFVTYTTPVPLIETLFAEGAGRDWGVLRGYITEDYDVPITTINFDYGSTDAYGDSVSLTPVELYEGDYFVLTARGLDPGVDYHFRATATTANGEGLGEDEDFSTIGSETLYEHLDDASTGDSDDIYADEWSAQQFTADTMGHTVTTIQLYLKRVLLPGTVTVSLKHADGADKPSGIDLTIATFDGDDLSVGYSWVTIPVKEYTLEGGEKYAIVVRALGGDAANHIVWSAIVAGGLANAVGMISDDGGNSWVSDAPEDYEFRIWGYPSAVVNGAGVFANYLETGDMLFIADVTNIYQPYYPEYDTRAYFDVILYADDGTTVVASTPLVDWGRRPQSIYLSADSANPITWGDDMYIKMVGSFDPANIIASYQLTTADWWESGGQGLFWLDQWVIRMARSMETFYGLTLITHVEGKDTEGRERGDVLNEAGGVEISKGISGYSEVRPNKFETIVNLPTYTRPTWTNAFQSATTWQDQVGATVETTMEDLGDIIGMDGSGAFQILLYIVILFIFVATRSFLLGSLIAFPIAAWGLWVRIMPIIPAMILIALIFYIIYWKTWGSK